MALELIIDGAQPRLAKKRIAAFAQGAYPADGGLADGHSRSLGQDVWIEPTRRGMLLRPRNLYEAWETSNSGAYAKLGIGDFALTDSDKWSVMPYSEGLRFLQYTGDVFPAEGVTNATYGRNRGMVVGWYSYGAGAGTDGVDIECGWNTEADGGLGPSFRFMSDGRVEVWKDELKRGEYNLSAGDQPSVTQGRYIEAMIIPCRRREWIVATTAGGSFVHVDTDLDEDEDDPELVADTNFWFSVPSQRPTVLVAPIRFATSGWGASTTVGLAEDPGAREATTFCFYDGPGSATAALKGLDGASAWNHGTDGLRARLRYELTGDGERSPCVNAGLWDVPAESRSTTGEGIDVADVHGENKASATEIRLDVSDHCSGVSLRTEIRDPDSIDGTLREGYNRPGVLKVEGLPVFDGRSGGPEEENRPYAIADRLYLEFRDGWKGLEKATLRDPMPLDGLSFADALKRLLLAAGIGSGRTAIWDDGFLLPRGESPSTGGWAAIVEPTEENAVGRWIERLLDDYAADWFYGFRPKGGSDEFYAFPPDQYLEPVSTVYSKVQTALDAGATVGHVYRNLRRTTLEPEANHVRVTGYDPRTRRPISVYKEDVESMDPTLPPGERPANWLGEMWEAIFVEPAATSWSALERMCERLFARLSVARRMVQWESGMLFTEERAVWRGDVVTLHGIGDVRVRTLSARFARWEDVADGFRRIDTIYTGELIGT